MQVVRIFIPADNEIMKASGELGCLSATEYNIKQEIRDIKRLKKLPADFDPDLFQQYIDRHKAAMQQTIQERQDLITKYYDLWGGKFEALSKAIDTL
jgi:hypothetical protein